MRSTKAGSWAGSIDHRTAQLSTHFMVAAPNVAMVTLTPQYFLFYVAFIGRIQVTTFTMGTDWRSTEGSDWYHF